MEVAKKYEISETNARNIFCKAPCKYNFAADAKNGKRCESRRVLHSSWRMCSEMAEKSKGIPNVFVLDTSINIFNAINLCVLLVSEESSTLYEAMMLEKLIIAVTDWLVPDNNPREPWFPDFPYDFAVHVTKDKLGECIKDVLFDEEYTKKLKEYRLNNFPKEFNIPLELVVEKFNVPLEELKKIL